jgi:hypothetical protein
LPHGIQFCPRAILPLKKTTAGDATAQKRKTRPLVGQISSRSCASLDDVIELHPSRPSAPPMD